jgi:REP element-mobilizing transposase RayT
MASILSDIKESLTKADCHLHAYVILTNHVHLFVPTEHEDAISKIKHFDTIDCVIDLGVE